LGNMYMPSQLLAAILVGCASTATEQPPALSDAPAIVIRQYPDYPIPGLDSKFPGGLVAALWRDGRMIRPASPDSIGKSYVEGVVSAAERDAFFTFLSSSSAVRTLEGGVAPLHAATQSITVRRDGAASRWTRMLPDTESAWREVESRLLALPIGSSHTVDWAAVRSSSWYAPSQSTSVDLASLPDVREGSYKVAPYIRTAAALQKMGREAACEALLRAA